MSVLTIAYQILMLVFLGVTMGSMVSIMTSIAVVARAFEKWVDKQ